MRKVILGIFLGLPFGFGLHLLGIETSNYSSSNRWHECMDYRKSKGLVPLPYCWRAFSAKCSPLWEGLATYEPMWWDNSPIPPPEFKDPEDGKCSFE